MNRSRVTISDEIAMQILQGLMPSACGYHVVKDAIPRDAKLVAVERADRAIAIVFETAAEIPWEICPQLEAKHWLQGDQK